MRKPKGDYAIQTVINAMRLLEAFRDVEELGVTELSQRLGLHKNNIFRLLATLEQQGYIEQSRESERYRLGVRTLELGQSFSRGRSLSRSALPVVRELAEQCGEVVHLGVLREFAVVHLLGEQVERAVMSPLRLGRRLPVHCTALGKVLMGGAPQEVRERFDAEVRREPLAGRTDETVTDPHKLLEEFRSVAVRGFALDVGECDEGLTCAAAPVHGPEGLVVASISVSGPISRLDADHLNRVVVPAVTEAAERVSRRLGHLAG